MLIAKENPETKQLGKKLVYVNVIYQGHGPTSRTCGEKVENTQNENKNWFKG